VAQESWFWFIGGPLNGQRLLLDVTRSKLLLSRGNGLLWRYERTRAVFGGRFDVFSLDGQCEQAGLREVVCRNYLFVGGPIHGHRLELLRGTQTHQVRETVGGAVVTYRRLITHLDGEQGSAFFIGGMIDLAALREAVAAARSSAG
jgi:hypothetical protein